MAFWNLRFFALAVGGCLFAGGFGARAQARIGIRAGANVATLVQVVPTGQPTAELLPLLGGQLGLMFNVGTGKVAFQPALLFSQRGYGAGDSEFPVTAYSRGDTLFSSYQRYTRKGKDYVRLSYLEVPLNVVYTLGGTFGAQLIVGPYVALGLSGKHHSDGFSIDQRLTKTVGGQVVAEQTTRLAEDGPRETPVSFSAVAAYGQGQGFYFRRQDVGLTAGFGFASGPVQVQALYSWGLSDLMPPTYAIYGYGTQTNYRQHHRVGQLTLTYLVGKL